MAKKKDILRTGRKGIEEGMASDYVGLKDGDKQTMVSQIELEDMISFDQHVIWIDGGSSPMFPCIKRIDICPGCELKNQARFKAVLPVIALPEKEPKLYSFGISVARGIEALEEDWGELKGRTFAVKRTGTGLKTKYTVIGSGKSVDVDPYEDEMLDVSVAIGPQTREGIVALLVETDILDADALDEFDDEEEVKPKKKKKKPAKTVVEDDEEDDDDWEEVS